MHSGDLDTKVEIEEDRFIRDTFTALQADLRALGRGGRTLATGNRKRHEALGSRGV